MVADVGSMKGLLPEFLPALRTNLTKRATGATVELVLNMKVLGANVELVVGGFDIERTSDGGFDCAVPVLRIVLQKLFEAGLEPVLFVLRRF